MTGAREQYISVFGARGSAGAHRRRCRSRTRTDRARRLISPRAHRRLDYVAGRRTVTRTTRRARRRIAAAHPQRRFAKYPWPEEDARYAVAWQSLADGDIVHAGDENPDWLLHTPGHSPDHVAFWHEPAAPCSPAISSMLGGSVMIHSSRGGDLAQLPRVARTPARAAAARRLLPAHGPADRRSAAVLAAYIEHRRDARAAGRWPRCARAATRCRRSPNPSMMVSTPALMPAARENVRAHLEKLKTEGLAANEDDRWPLSEPRERGSRPTTND